MLFVNFWSFGVFRIASELSRLGTRLGQKGRCTVYMACVCLVGAVRNHSRVCDLWVVVVNHNGRMCEPRIRFGGSNYMVASIRVSQMEGEAVLLDWRFLRLGGVFFGHIS